MDMRISEHLPVSNAGSGLQGMTLNEFLEILWRSRWLIAGIVLAFILAGLTHVTFAQPIYRSDALLRVGQEGAGMGALGDSESMSQVFEVTTVDMELQLLKSRMVLGQVVDYFNMDINAWPVYLPLLGARPVQANVLGGATVDEWLDWLEKKGRAWLNLDASFDLDKYARGDEYIQIERFDIPADYQGWEWTLVARQGRSFEIQDSQGQVVTNGTVGEPIEKWLPTDQPHTLLISRLSARPGTHFKLSRSLHLPVVDGLGASLAVTLVGDPEQQAEEAGLLEISMEGPDPEEITAIINHTLDVYMRESAERKSAQVKGALRFLNEQLPELKAQVERAEAALNDYRLQQGSVDLQMETQAILNKLVSVENELSDMGRRREALLRRFTPRHDRVIAFDAEIASLAEREAGLQREVQRLPKTQQEMLRLTRNVKANGQLYTFLLNRKQQLQVIKAATSGDAQLVDSAEVPYAPVAPVKNLIVLMYSSLGMGLGIGAALLRKSLAGGAVEDPDTIEKEVGLPVYAVVPHSPSLYKLSRKHRLRPKRCRASHSGDIEDIAIESVRGLRTWLNFAFPESKETEAKNNVLLITGPSPGVGKSFLSVNLGIVLADAGKRVLVIDADLRKGHLHQYLNMRREAGLSEAIAGAITTQQAIHETEIDNLFIIPTGSLPPKPSELLLNKRLESIVKEVSAEYDHVIIDSPPVLAVTDAAVVGGLTSGALLVVKANVHPVREIEQCVKRLRRSGVNLLGVVFNDMDTSRSRYGYAKYYGYSYGG